MAGVRSGPGLSDEARLPWTTTDWILSALLGLGALVAIARFWLPGIASDADMLMAIHRLLELEQAWRQGILYPRLGPNLNFTYGGPLFQFYPPLASYLGLAFRAVGLGFVESVKAVFTLNLLLGGLGAFLYARWLLRRRLAAWVAGMAFLFAPYLLLDAYERGAVSEALAWAMIPWLFWSLHQVLETGGRGWRLAAAGLVALLVLAHNITALFVLPAVTLYLLVLAWRQHSLRQMAPVAGALALGLGLSAFYWAPALAEVRFTQAATVMLGAAYSPEAHLTTLGDLVQRTLVADYWGATRFRLALWQAVLGMGGILLLAVQPSRLRWPLALLAAIWLAVMLVQLTVTDILWQNLPLIRFVQFPWRLLGLASFCVALLTGSIFLWQPLQGRLGGAIAVATVLGIAVLGTASLRPELSPLWSPVTSADITVAGLFERSRVTEYALAADYRPLALEIGTQELAAPRPADAALSAPLPVTPTIQVVLETPNRVELAVHSPAPIPLRIHRIYFPGWEATVDGLGVPVSATPPLGLVTAEAPAGAHDVVFRYRGTALQQAAALLSVASLVLWCVLLAHTRRGRVALTLGAAAVLLIVALPPRREEAQRPIPISATFGNELRLLGVSLPQWTWRPGQLIPMRLTWFAQKTPSMDYSVFVHLVPSDDAGQVAQTDSQPILGYGPATRWEPGEIVVDEHALVLDPSTPPGRYRLVAGWYRADTVQNLPVSAAAEVLPGDRVVLGEIEILAE